MLPVLQTAYVDVCDDCSYAVRAKGYHDAARQAGVPAITTGGIYPGVSNRESATAPPLASPCMPSLSQCPPQRGAC